MHKMNIRPLSVNRKYCIKKHRTKGGGVAHKIADTAEFRAYAEELSYRLPPNSQINKKGLYGLVVRFGFSTIGADLDNPVKPLLDAIQKKYGINDKQVFQLYVEKCIVFPGQEFIEFELVEIRESLWERFFRGTSKLLKTLK